MTDPLQLGLEDFGFQFPDGFKFAKDMARDDLLRVIQYMRKEREHQRKSFNEFQSVILETFL